MVVVVVGGGGGSRGGSRGGGIGDGDSCVGGGGGDGSGGGVGVVCIFVGVICRRSSFHCCHYNCGLVPLLVPDVVLGRTLVSHCPLP